MAARGIRGQSITSDVYGVALFGGFDDHLVRVDLLTGRVTQMEAAGRTVLYPWDAAYFLCLEDALGRPSKTRLTMRSLAEPEDTVAAHWGGGSYLIPGHYPTVIAVSDETVTHTEVPVQAHPSATVSFLPGVFTEHLPVLVDGGWTSADGSIVAGVGVGRYTTAYFATPRALIVARDRAIVEAVAIDKPWRPEVIEHDPVRRRVLVGSWNRWGSLGGPSSDVYVFDEAGVLLAQGQADALVERMVLTDAGVTVMDVEDKVRAVELQAAAS